MEETWDSDGETTAAAPVPETVYNEIRQRCAAPKFSGFGYDDDGDRTGGGDEGGIRLQVEFSKKGMIIGRGGSKIREIQEQFNCTVNCGKSRERSCPPFRFEPVFIR